MKEVYPGIFSLREKGSFGAIKPPENIYVLAGSNGLIFDAGYGHIWTIKRLMKEFLMLKQKYQKQSLPFEITRVLPSHVHPDHFSGLKLLRKYLGVNIVLTQKMADIIKHKRSFIAYYESENPLKEEYQAYSARNLCNAYLRKFFSRIFFKGIYGLSFINKPDDIIEEPSIIDINGEEWALFSSPGHSSDHISLYNKEKGILFSGDNILRSITTWLGPPNSDIEQYVESINTIRNLPHLKLILPAHGSPIENPYERIQQILIHRKERTEQVLQLIQDHSNKGISSNSIIMSLYPTDGKFKHGVARGWVSLTLKMLTSQGLISSRLINNEIRFFPSK